MEFAALVVSPASLESPEKFSHSPRAGWGVLFHVCKLYTDDNFPEKKINTKHRIRDRIMGKVAAVIN